MEEQDGTVNHAGEGLVETNATDLPLVIRPVEADDPRADPAKSVDIPVDGAGDAELVGIAGTERGGETKQRDAPGREVMIGGEVDAKAVLGGEADNGLAHCGAARGVGGEQERSVVTTDNDDGREEGAPIAPGGRAKAVEGGIDFSRIEADGELVGAVVGALIIVVQTPGLRIDVGEGGNESVGVAGECRDRWIIGEGGVAGDFHEHFGERFGKAERALAAVGSGDDGGGLVEGGGELGFRLWGEQGEQDQESEGDGAGHGGAGPRWDGTQIRKSHPASPVASGASSAPS